MKESGRTERVTLCSQCLQVGRRGEIGVPALRCGGNDDACIRDRAEMGRSSAAPLPGRMPRLGLELQADRKLGLPRVAHANAEEAVEVEELRRRQRIHVVLVVEGVEHLELGHDAETFAEMEWAS